MKVGLIGIGGMGGVHFNVYAGMDDVELAVADIRTDMAQEKAGDRAVAVYATLDDLLAHFDADVIDICTPSYLHADMAVAALNAGKHVLCEKPVALSSVDADRILESARRNGRIFMTAHVVRFMTPYMYLKSVIDSGELGRPVHIMAHRLSAVPRWSWENWMLDLEKSGGTPFDLSIHDIDFFRYCFGDPTDVKATYHALQDHNDFISSTLCYDGFDVEITGAWYNASYPFNAGYTAIFENGYVESKDGRVIRDGRDVALSVGDLCENTGINLSGVDGYAGEIVYFLDCVKQGTEPRIVAPEDGRESVKLVERILTKSVRT